METIELLKIQDLFKHLSTKIDALTKSEPIQPSYRSEQVKDLVTALAKAQSEMPISELNKGNPYFKSKYADLCSVVESSRPSLTKHGLAVTYQIIHHLDGRSMLETTLWHTTGQFLKSCTRITPVKNDVQSMSSYITYLKRLSYASLVCVVSGEDDDDGEAAVATSRQLKAKGTALNMKYNPKETNVDVITKEQLEELEYELGDYPDIAEDVLDGLKIQSLADMPKSKFLISIKRIREIKNSRNGTNQ